jgi:hypothetical protein
MSKKLLRVYKKMDIDEVKSHLLIYGDLGGMCAHCQKMDIKLEESHCCACHAEFRYIAFRNVHGHMSKILNLQETHPCIAIVDYDDYRHHIGALKAQEFLRHHD